MEQARAGQAEALARERLKAECSYFLGGPVGGVVDGDRFAAEVEAGARPVATHSMKSWISPVAMIENLLPYTADIKLDKCCVVLDDYPSESSNVLMSWIP